MVTSDIKQKRIDTRAFLRFCDRLLFPLLLFLYPFVGIRQGIDVADTTYALANSLYVDRLDPMWLLATWLPNLLGAAVVRLPGGGTLLGAKVWCTLVVCATAELAWFSLGRLSVGRDGGARFPGWMRFIGLWIAESLCWCPVVILYNYLTYFFMALASVFLLFAFFAVPGAGGGDRSRMRLLFCAGVCLGLNLFVRFPNAAETLFLAAVWFDAAQRERARGAGTGRSVARRIGRETGVCVGGYITGVMIPLVIICVRYGIFAYADMVGGLFSMTAGAADYTPGGMLLSIVRAYGVTLAELLFAVPVLATGFGMFLLAERAPRVKRIAVIAYAFLLALLFRWYLATGVITRNYQYYDSVFELSMMVVILSLLLSALAVFGVIAVAAPLRSAAFLMLLTILVTPLGSNNYTFPVINNLFLVLPVALALLAAAIRQLSQAARGEAGWRSFLAAGFHLPALTFAAALLLLLVLQGTLFHARFAFGDGTDGAKRDTVVTEIPRARGMVTTAANARTLTELYQRCFSGAVDRAEPRSAIVFGSAPGLHYLLDLSPALFTAWPDLGSNETARIEAALSALAQSDDRPLVILRGDARREGSPWDFGAPEKAELILDYLSETGYNELFRVDSGEGVFYAVYDMRGSADEDQF